MNSPFSVELAQLNGQQIQKRFLQRAKANFIPATCIFEITPSCNANCYFCLRGDSIGNAIAQMPYEKVCSVLTELADAGCFHLVLSGGEPLTRRDFVPIARHARELGFSTSIFTNAMALNEKLIAEIDELNLSEVTVSVHSIDPSTHQKMFGLSRQMVSNVIDNINQLRSTGNKVTVHAVLTSDNIQQWSEFKRFFLEQGVSSRRITAEIVHISRDGRRRTLASCPSQEQIHDFYLADDLFPDMVRKPSVPQ